MIATDLFLWTDDLNVNIQEVDEQHKELVGLINQLHVAIVEHHGKVAAREIFDQLTENTRTHFLLEESLMRLTHYSGFTPQKEQHEALLEQMRTLQHKLDSEHTTVTIELLHFLKDWLTQHIHNSDRHLNTHIERSGPGQYSKLDQEPGRVMQQKRWWKLW